MTERVTTVDGVHLAVRRWDPLHPTGDAAVVAHGFAGSKDHESVTSLAEALCRRGLLVLAHDGRGHGRSGGRCTLGDLERLDVAAVIAAAAEDADRVVAVGASMGGIAALGHAADRGSRLSGVVTVSIPAHWRLHRSARSVVMVGLTRSGLGRWAARRRLAVVLEARWGSPPSPAELTPMVRAPYAIVHGRDDRLIPWPAAVELYDRAPEPRWLDVVDGMGHAYDPASLRSVTRGVAWALAHAERSHPASAPT